MLALLHLAFTLLPVNVLDPLRTLAFAFGHGEFQVVCKQNQRAKVAEEIDLIGDDAHFAAFFAAKCFMTL